MATTTEIRSIMRHFGCEQIYTNKTRMNPGTARRVKCYAPHNAKVRTRLLNQLIRAVGVGNVAYHSTPTTPGCYSYPIQPSITVACDLG